MIPSQDAAPVRSRGRSADLRDFQHPGEVARKSLRLDLRTVAEHGPTLWIDDQERRHIIPESVEPCIGRQHRYQPCVPESRPLTRPAGTMYEYPHHAVVVLAEGEVHALHETESRLAHIVTRRFDGVQQDPTPGRGLGDPVEFNLPGGLDEFPVVHPAERAPVRPPHVERVRGQDRNHEHREQPRQGQPVPPSRSPARFSVAVHHGP